MINSIFILNNKGEILVEKHWKSAIPRRVGEQFWEEVQKAYSINDVPPVIATQKYYLIHVLRDGIFYVGVATEEVQPLMVIEFLNRTDSIFKHYFNTVSEEVIKNNFVTVYQLLDEMVDYGMPINTEVAVLKELITQPTVFKKVKENFYTSTNFQGNLPDTATSLPWRSSGIKYTTNEVYFDVVENVDCVLDSSGMCVSSEINGTIHVNCKLSGMPDVALYFKDSSLFDDSSFHPCVRYAKYEQDRSLSFVPPDGVFDVMNYRVSTSVHMPIYVRPQISFNESGGRVQIMAGIKPITGKIATVHDVVVSIPMPDNVMSADVSASVGSVKFDLQKKLLVWDMGKVSTKQTPSLTGGLTTKRDHPVPESTPPVFVNFEIPRLALSGVEIDSVEVHNIKYKLQFKGVRYLTKAGKYQIRTC
eukprot:gb/GECH01013715.1/.p1 GENE.gb/GECH01013715.1/~~gb/GECH01013715.1/.p1  ORF type:complete len:418 (+),score=84.00 gb/GECH01013715.1/:1-1254(+)